jgi:SAM-dependent methyltransferase
MTTDILEIALRDPVPGAALLVERGDGHRSVTDLAWWRREPAARQPVDTEILDWIKPGQSAVDVGCATGRHLEILHHRGIAVIGVDSCATAVAFAAAHGLAAVHGDATVWSPPEPVNVVAALGGGLGICGTLDQLGDWLAHLAGWVTPGGRLLVTSVDWRGPGHGAWGEAARSRDAYPGEVTFRLRYRDQVGDWFPWLWVDPPTLRAYAQEAGLNLVKTMFWGAKYAAELRKEPLP